MRLLAIRPCSIALGGLLGLTGGCLCPIAVYVSPDPGSNLTIHLEDEEDKPIQADGLAVVRQEHNAYFSEALEKSHCETRVVEVRAGQFSLPKKERFRSLWLTMLMPSDGFHLFEDPTDLLSIYVFVPGYVCTIQRGHYPMHHADVADGVLPVHTLDPEWPPDLQMWAEPFRAIRCSDHPQRSWGDRLSHDDYCRLKQLVVAECSRLGIKPPATRPR